MPIKNYTTKIDVFESLGEIQGALARNGARKIMVDYDDRGRPVGITFGLQTAQGGMLFQLPANTPGVMAAFERQKIRPDVEQAAIDFFMQFANADCSKIAIENPVGIMSTYYRKPDQIIQPWQFGHGETKKTCLWLKGLPPLISTEIVEGREQRIWKMPPSEDRAKNRAKTFPGIARAMAEQWAGDIREGSQCEK